MDVLSLQVVNLGEEVSRHLIQGVVWALQLLLDGFIMIIRTPSPPPGGKNGVEKFEKLAFAIHPQ